MHCYFELSSDYDYLLSTNTVKDLPVKKVKSSHLRIL